MKKQNIRKLVRFLSKQNLYFLGVSIFLTIFFISVNLKLQAQYSMIDSNVSQNKLNFEAQQIKQQGTQKFIEQFPNSFNYHLKSRNLQVNKNYPMNIKMPQIPGMKYQAQTIVNNPFLRNDQKIQPIPVNTQPFFDNSNPKLIESPNQNKPLNMTKLSKQNYQQPVKLSTPYQYISSNVSITQEQIDFANKLKKLEQQSQYTYRSFITQQKVYYEKKYNVSLYGQQPFCIFVPSFNNVASERYISNLNSIFRQQYSNYHIIFIDDGSDDKTGEKVRQFAKNHQISKQKLKIIVNTERKMAMPNIYKAAYQYCQLYQIFMIIDGDDELIGTQIVKLYNALFQQNDYWLVYTNFITNYGSMGYSRPYSPQVIENKLFRSNGFVISHLRAFYTKLFTLIKEQDLKDSDGKWFRAANDVAMYMPILQMAQNKFSYVPEICYSYNSNTGLNNHIIKRQKSK